MLRNIEPPSTLYTLASRISSTLYQEYGYRELNEGNATISADDEIMKISWRSPNDSTFLVLFLSHNSQTNCLEIFERHIDDCADMFCSLFVCYENGKFNFFRKNVKTKLLEKCNDIPIYKSTKTFNAENNFTNLSENFESIFFEAHSFLRDIDGLHPDEALDELCKVIYAKLYYEENDSGSKIDTFSPVGYGNQEELAASIRKLYCEANSYDIRVFSLRIPGYKRSRGVFDEPLKLSSLAISKVAEIFSRFSFSKSEIDIKARAFQNVYKPTSRAGMGQYFTPVNVIKFIVEAVAPKKEDLILDPFCGSAHFLTESINIVSKSGCSEKQLTDFVFYKLHGIEKSERMVRVAMTDMRMHGDGHSNIRCIDALLPFENYYDIEPNSFDVIMTNPPFGSVLSSEALEYMGDFEMSSQRKNTPLEILGIERCIQLLRDNGKLAIVLPESIFVNKTFEYVRKWLLNKTQIKAIVSLPIETFAPFGTNIKTSILFCKKKYKQDYKNQNVFTGGIDNIGYDSSGKATSDDDWKGLLSELKEFLNAEGW